MKRHQQIPTEQDGHRSSVTGPQRNGRAEGGAPWGLRLLGRALILIALTLVLLIFTGCGKREVLGGLDLKQATILVNVLTAMQIEADREPDAARGRNTYRIVVADSDYNRALQIVSESIPPDDNSAQLNKLTESSLGSVLSPELQSLKFDYALGLEIERLLLALPGVMYSRAKVSSKYGGASRAGGISPSASVIIRYASVSGNVPFVEEDVRQTVGQVVVGIQPKDLKVSIINAIPTRFQGSAPTHNGELPRNTFAILGVGVGVSFVLGGLLTFYLVRRSNSNMRTSRVRKQTDKVRVGEGLR